LGKPADKDRLVARGALAQPPDGVIVLENGSGLWEFKGQPQCMAPCRGERTRVDNGAYADAMVNWLPVLMPSLVALLKSKFLYP